MTVEQKTICNTIYPRILFNNNWLIKLGFSHETLVVASYEADVLTLQAHGKGEKIVNNMHKSKQHLCQVLDQQRYDKNEAHLIIKGTWLARHGFNAGDVILYKADQGLIQIKKLDLDPLGFDPAETPTSRRCFLNMDVKIMRVSHETNHDNKRPQIKFKGVWLEELGFSHKTLVVASYENNILTLQAHGKGMDIYKKLVGSVRKNKQHLCQVLDQRRHYIKEPHLIIEGAWLARQGFHVGDVILYKRDQGLIQIKKLDLSSLGFDSTEGSTYKIIQVQKSSKHKKVVPLIQLKGDWLIEHGFHMQNSVLVSYETNGINFLACAGKKMFHSTGGTPLHININQDRNKPFFQLKGAWLFDGGYQIGDLLIIQIKQGAIHLKRLDNKYLSFSEGA